MKQKKWPQRFPLFRIGERVAMTQAALRQGLQGRAWTATGIVEARRGRTSVKVRRDGLKTASWYWTPFWRHLSAASPRAGGKDNG